MAPNPVIDIIEARFPKKNNCEIDKWYNEIHIPILFKSLKLQAIARYKVVDDSSEYERYIVICKYKNKKDFQDFLSSQEFQDAGKDKPPSMDVQVKSSSPIHCELVMELAR